MSQSVTSSERDESRANDIRHLHQPTLSPSHERYQKEAYLHRVENACDCISEKQLRSALATGEIKIRTNRTAYLIARTQVLQQHFFQLY